MKNAEKFKEIFKEFATEVWAFPEKDFLTWLNAEYEEPTTKNDLGVDLISREQAKAAIRDKFKDLPSRVEINTILNEMPSVTPQEPRKGHWIPYLKEGLIVKCSECGSRFSLGYNYCPYCGVDMREVEE